jgi:hypothetical protein
LGLVNFPRDAAAFPELELIDLSDNQMQTIPNRINIFTVSTPMFLHPAFSLHVSNIVISYQSSAMTKMLLSFHVFVIRAGQAT